MWIFVILIFSILCPCFSKNSCQTPTNRKGFCIAVKECDFAMKILRKGKLSWSEKRFLQESQVRQEMKRFQAILLHLPYCQCKTNLSGDLPFICCPGQNTFSSNLPPPGICGKKSSIDRIYGGKEANLDEFPWIALLEYQLKDGTLEFQCGGSLISHRYVLSAAHCLTGRILVNAGPLVNVRLGEHNIESEIDCVRHGEIEDCADPPLTIGVERSIPHPYYQDNDMNRYNDIGLIRLNLDIKFTDFIQPVCLPLENHEESKTDDKVMIAGFGRTLEDSRSRTKQKLQIPIFDHEKCKTKFIKKGVTIHGSQICAGGRFAEDSCDGDSGGGLMTLTNSSYWTLEGIVSFGYLCGLEGWPGVYTRVSYHRKWILANIKE